MGTKETELWKFVMKGDWDGVNGLLTADIEILRKVTAQGDSAMHVAAARGHHQMVDNLFQQMPCMLLIENFRRETPLHTAAKYGKSDVVEVLLNMDDVFQCNCNSSSCGGSLEVQEIWKNKNDMGATALHLAVKGNYPDAVDLLLDKVQGIELIDNSGGLSPLSVACLFDCLEIAKKLLLRPEISDTMKDGTSCLHLAITNILQWKLKGNGYLQWHDCALELAFELVDKRPQLAKAVESSGNSPLHLLVNLPFPHEKHLELVDKLLEAAPDMNFRLNKDGMAPIHIAASTGHVKVMKRLMDSAPQCSYLLSKDCKNALHFVLKQDNGLSRIRKLDCLLQDSLDISFLLNEPDSEGNTAMSIADEELVQPVKQFILERMWGKSPPGPNIFKKVTRPPPRDDHARLETRAVKEKSRAMDDTKLRRLTIAEGEKAKENAKENVEGKDQNDRLSVIAALIATISFAAAFTIPGGFNDNGRLILLHQAALKAFILSDSVAFSLSMLSLLQLIYSPSTGAYTFLYTMLANTLGRRTLEERVGPLTNFEQQLARWGGRCLFWSLNATMVAFATGVYVAVAPKCLWLAITVCTITFGGLLVESILPTICLLTAAMWEEDWWVFYDVQVISIKNLWIWSKL